MSTADPRLHRAAPDVVPRWEWRTFGDLDEDERLDFLRAEPAAVSHEQYVLSVYNDSSVKVRDHLLDAKVLQRVNAAGLQLWKPVLKAPFPVADEDVGTAFEALGSARPPAQASGVGQRELLSGLLGARDDLNVVEVRKGRRRSVLAGCMVELTELTTGGRTVQTVAVESPDAGLVVDTMRRLGLEGRPNTCVARGLKSVLGWGPSRFAVIDVGTNSVKVVRGERRGRGEADVEVDTAVVTRLGEGLAEAGELTPTAMRRTADVVAGLVEDARRDGPVEIVAVGTAGLRQAPNRDAFVDAVFSRCGVGVEVISGTEEARLAYLAAVSTLQLTGDRLLVFDSGGGSSQFTWGSPASIEDQFSLDVGAVRFTERFGLADPVTRDTVARALAAISRELERLHERPAPDMVIAIGGTSTNLAAVKHGLARYDPAVVHGTVVDLGEVDRQIEDYRRCSADERRLLPGLQPARAEVILAGACIVRSILTLTGQQAVTVSDRGLRHGVVAERFGS